MKKILFGISGFLIVMILVIVVKTLTFRSMQIEIEPVALPDFGAQSISNLSKAITYPTISYEVDLPVDTQAFRGFHQFLEESYPSVHARLKKEVIQGLSLLFTWEGRNPGLKPVILMAHMDVVPTGEKGRWEHSPFSGMNDGTFIWGRGTLDDKQSLIGILEAVERLIRENYVPERTVYLAFGHDEEISGNGAMAIAKTLKERGVDAAFVLDEGLGISVGIVPMMNKPVASIGISEKGYLSVRLITEMEGGHSSMPKKETAVTVLNDALYKINKHPMKADISGPIKEFIRFTGPEMPFLPKVVFANLWLFKGILLKVFEGGSATNAAIRTTTSVTMVKAGIKDNVVPSTAEAVLNFRIIPGETSGDVVQYLTRVISDDRVKIAKIGSVQKPSPVSPVDGAGFELIHKTIREVFPEVVVNPMLVLATTDSRHYSLVSSSIYRFAPIITHQEDLARIHGLNERISIENYARAIGFYYQLIKNIS